MKAYISVFSLNYPHSPVTHFPPHSPPLSPPPSTFPSLPPSLLLLEGEVADALHLVLVRVDLLQNVGQKLGEVVR